MSETESACVCVRGCSQTSFFLLTVSVFSEAALLGMLFSFSFPKNFSRGFLVWTVLMLPKALKHSSCSCLQEHCQLLEQEHEILCCLFTTFLFRTSSLYFALHETSFLFFFFLFPCPVKVHISNSSEPQILLSTYTLLDLPLFSSFSLPSRVEPYVEWAHFLL